MKSTRKWAKAFLLTLALFMMTVTSAQAASANQQTGNVTTTKAYTGWIESGGYRYYYRNGVKLTGWQTISGYRFYFNKYGRALTGWQTISGYRFYFNKYGRALTGWQTISGNRFYFNKYGRALTGWQKIGGHYYYFNPYGRALIGWQNINGHKYYFYSNGRAATGTLTLNGIRYTFNDHGRVISSSSTNPSIRRAVVIGEANYTYAQPLPACTYDANAMTRMLKKTGYTTVTTKINATKTTIKNAISSTFAAADSNDVSLFYYSGHGSGDGSLCAMYGTGDYYISTSTLASWLKQVPGTVIVLLDSCYSGAVINKSADGTVTTQNLKDFNTNVINAFADTDTTAKSGEMCTNKFQVITACTMLQTSGCYSTYSLFTNGLITGAGYDYSGSKQSSAPADYNKDKKLGLAECGRYTYLHIYGQDAQYYPTDSTFTLFTRY